MTRNADAHFSVGTAANRQLNVPAPSHLMTWSADSLAQNQPSIPSLGNLNLRNPGIWSKREELTPRRQSPVVAARMARIVSSSNISPRYTTFTQRWSPVSPLDLSLTQSSHRAQTAGERGFAFIARYGGIARSPARQAASRSGQSPELETSVASRQTSQHSSLPVEMTPRDRSLKRQIITERKLRIVRQESSTPGASSSNLACLSEANGSRTRLLSQEQLKKQGSSIHHGGETGLTDKSPVAAPLTVEQLLKKPPQKASTSVGRHVQTPEISISLRGSFSAGNDSLSSAHVAELSTTTARELPSGGVPCVVPHRMSDKSMSASISSCVHPVIVQRRRCSDCTTKPAPSATTSPGTMTATTAGATPTTSSNRSQSSVETVTDIPSVGQVAAPYNGQKSSFVSSRLVMQQFVQRWSNHYEENKKAYFEGGYMSVVPGKKLNSRYVIVQKLGWGEFSTVWLAYDTLHTTLGKPHQAFVAVKIAKCDSVVSESTQYEIKLLRYIGSNTPSHAPLTGLLDSFEVAGQYGSHTCMVMPLHGSNLLSIIDQMKAKKGIRSPSEISLIKEIVVSILIGLDELDKLDVIHTDIKPENILCSSSDPKVLDTIENFCLRNKDRSSMVPADRVRKAMWQGDPNHLVCIADFGLSVALKPSKGQAVTGKGQKDVAAKAAIESKKEFPVEKAGTVSNVRGTMIQTREYRAPEILMGMDFNTRTDIWSVGCMVYELITGEFLMDPKRRTRNERMMDVEHLAMMMQILGPVPEKIIKLREGCGNGKPPPRYIHRYFDENNRFIYSDKYRLYPRRHIDRELQAYLPPAEAKSAAAFIVGCLASYEPTSRPSAGEMLNHTWLYDATNN